METWTYTENKKYSSNGKYTNKYKKNFASF